MGLSMLASLSGGAIAGIVIGVIAALILILLLCCYLAARYFVYPKRYTYDYIDIESTMEDVNREWYESLPVENFWVKSQYGYDLSCNFLEGKTTDKIIVFVHGYTYNIVGSMKYIKRFMDLGYSMFFYDHTACGASGGKMSTFGVHEADDLGTIVKYIRDRWGKDVKIGLHGESMGAATSILYAQNDPKISFVIEDCGYSDAFNEIFSWAKVGKSNALMPFIKLTVFMAGKITGVTLDQANPLKVFENGGLKDIPVLFAHGDVDPKTPCWMCEKMYEAKQGPKQKLIVEGAIHARCITKNPELYMNTVKEFLKMTDFTDEA